MKVSVSKWLLIAILLTLLNSCAPVGPNYALVNQDSTDATKITNITKDENTIYHPKYHLVRKGQTLYAISLLFNLNVQQLAQWNQITPPYKIEVGQKLIVSNRTGEKKDSISKIQEAPKIDAIVAEKKQRIADEMLINRTDSQKKNAVLLNNIPSLTNKQSYNGAQLNNATGKYESGQLKKPSISIDNESMLKLNFRWPIKGEVLKNFSNASNKGIDIAGEVGQEVSASESGTVVYSGQGLIGYGELLIIKHNDFYLSAYANNSSLLVAEGYAVKKGQIIAKVGKVGSSKTSLHFEIRKNGKPMNPLDFLPAKH